MPDVSMPLDIKVVEIVCVFHLAKVWTLQPLDDLCFHHSGDMSRQQGQQETLLTVEKRRNVTDYKQDSTPGSFIKEQYNSDTLRNDSSQGINNFKSLHSFCSFSLLTFAPSVDISVFL